MQVLRRFRGCLKYKDSSQMVNKALMMVDGFLALLCVLILVLSDNRSQCLASFYLFWSLYYLSQSIEHYLLMKIPKIDVIKFDLIIKRLIWIVCLVQVAYLLLVIIFWQKSNVHPIYCAVCGQFGWPYLVGIGFIIHFIISMGFMISLIHLFVTRKYYLIALGGFEIEQRIALERQQALRRIGLMEPNYAYPIDASIKSNKYYKFQDVIEEKINNQEICSICLNKKQQYQNIIKTKCNHFYHRSCIQTWATVNSRCPDCRTQFEQDDFTERKLTVSNPNNNLHTIPQNQNQDLNEEQQ